MKVRLVANLFGTNLADAITTVSSRIENAHDAGGRARLFVEDITAKKPNADNQYVVAAVVDATYPSHAAAAEAVSRALQLPVVSTDPKALVIVELQVKEVAK